MELFSEIQTFHRWTELKKKNYIPFYYCYCTLKQLCLCLLNWRTNWNKSNRHFVKNWVIKIFSTRQRGVMQCHSISFVSDSQCLADRYWMRWLSSWEFRDTHALICRTAVTVTQMFCEARSIRNLPSQKHFQL